MSQQTMNRWESLRTEETRLVEKVLRARFPQTDAYRYNSASIRVRIIDPRFEGLAHEERDAMVLPKSAYWKMNSFSFDPAITQLWFRLIELYLFVLSPQLSNVLLGAALYGCEFWSCP